MGEKAKGVAWSIYVLRCSTYEAFDGKRRVPDTDRLGLLCFLLIKLAHDPFATPSPPPFNPSPKRPSFELFLLADDFEGFRHRFREMD